MQQEEIRLELNKYLDNNEHLLWYGKPKDGIRFKIGDIFMIPFSIFWGGFVFYFGIDIFFVDYLFPKLFFIPFILIAIYITVGRFIIDILRRKYTIYAITENRVIIKTWKNIQSLDIKSLTNIIVNEKTNKSGNIIFGNSTITTEWMPTGMFLKNGVYAPPLLEMIEDARKVYKKIIELREKGYSNKTLKTIQDIEENKNLSKNFNSVKDLMKDLNT